MVHVGLELSRERSPHLTSFGAVHAPLLQGDNGFIQFAPANLSVKKPP